jgi:serine phosphatase RsbU (regulator of sigma subunit)
MFGEEPVKELLLKHASSGIEILQEAILRAIQEFTRGSTQTDDITIVIAERS